MSVNKNIINKLKIHTKKIKRKDMKYKTNAYKTGTLMAKRNRSIAIIEASKRKTYVVLIYVKITDGTKESYKVIAMEWKYRKLKSGYKKVLYAQDMNEGYRVKSFVHVNIQKVLIGHKKVKPFAFKVKI